MHTTRLDRILRPVLVLVMGGGLVLPAAAQEKREPEGSPLPPYAKQITLQDLRSPALRLEPVENGLPNVMLTGYWPPTNEMMRHFSANPEQNPAGWVGENWEGRGYNVYAFFPEFPQGLGKGVGDFEVDYQDTSVDFWPLVELLKPIAILSFGRADDDRDWELEGGNTRYPISSYINDYLTPFKPTPGLPFYYETAYTFRASTLPFQAIIDAVRTCGANVTPYSTAGDDSKFLCSYMGYHTNWYHEQHASPADPVWNVSSGFIHVGSLLTPADAILATEVTLRTLLTHMDGQRKVTGDMNCDGVTDFGDINDFVLIMANPAVWQTTHPRCLALNGDINNDGRVCFDDINPFAELLTNP
jgi:hypothetical protein